MYLLVLSFKFVILQRIEFELWLLLMEEAQVRLSFEGNFP